jgi:hypothetical protein
MIKYRISQYIKNNKTIFQTYLLLRDVRSYISYKAKGEFSQHGEDIFLNEYFASHSKGFYVDIGSSHPFRISNTYNLYRRGWSGIAVDAIPTFTWLYRLWRPRDVFVNVGIGADAGRMTYNELTPSVLSSFDEGYVKRLVETGEAAIHRRYEVNVITPNTLLERYCNGRKIDFLSIDVEGLDYAILRAIDFAQFRPSLISVEFNSEDDRHAMLAFFTTMRYEPVAEIGCNLLVADVSDSETKLNLC